MSGSAAPNVLVFFVALAMLCAPLAALVRLMDASRQHEAQRAAAKAAVHARERAAAIRLAQIKQEIAARFPARSMLEPSSPPAQDGTS